MGKFKTAETGNIAVVRRAGAAGLTTKGVTELLPPLWWWLDSYGLTELYTQRIYLIAGRFYLSFLKLKIRSSQVV